MNAPIFTETTQSTNQAAASFADSAHRLFSETTSQDSGYDGDIEVVKPYAIEEPEDNSAGVDQEPSISEQCEYKPSGQSPGSLVDDLEDLHCDSDNTDPKLRQGQNQRGKKRKPPTVDAGMPQNNLSNTSSTASRPGDFQYKAPSLSPKRPRRRRERSKEDGSFSSYIPGGNGSSVSSGSSSQSTGFSSPNNNNGSTAADDMDLD